MNKAIIITALLAAPAAACASFEVAAVSGTGPCVEVCLLDINKTGPDVSIGGVRARSGADPCPKIKKVVACIYTDENGNNELDKGEKVGACKTAEVAVPGGELQTGAFGFNQNDDQNGGSHYVIEVTDENDEVSVFGGDI
jgi:hypothetical protein